VKNEGVILYDESTHNLVYSKPLTPNVGAFPPAEIVGIPLL
jgi:hypothetical protein